MSSLSNKVALVTGGGTGIGRSIALSLADAGARVVVAGRRTGPLEEVAASRPDQISHVQLDVSDTASVRKAIATVIERHGQLDVLVNNAGVYFQGPVSELSDEQIDSLYDVNVKGLLVATREALPHLLETTGNVINISSVLGSGVAPATAAYSGTKSAVDQITRTLAAELGGQGIRVNCVAPGLTATDMSAPLTADEATLQTFTSMTPLGRLGEPDDIAKAVTFLASPGATWITGQILHSSGGLLL